MVTLPPPTIPPVVFDPLPMQIVGLILIVAVLAVYAAMTWLGDHANELREYLYCPVRLRMAKVIFQTGPGGERTDIVGCSIFGRRPITCGKACLAHPAQG